MDKYNDNYHQYDPRGPVKTEITPEKLYVSRRRFIQLALAGAGSLALAACGINPEQVSVLTSTPVPTPAGAAKGAAPTVKNATI